MYRSKRKGNVMVHAFHILHLLYEKAKLYLMHDHGVLRNILRI